MDAAITVDGLHKSFRVKERAPGFRGALRGLFTSKVRQVCAVEGLSFRVDPGERVAFVGPNGAGKSTTIKILSGILHPDAGQVRVLGYEPWSERQARPDDPPKHEQGDERYDERDDDQGDYGQKKKRH